jgi:tetratricopeptide (TPR) repeat protein
MRMDEHADTREHHARAETDEIVRLQTILARRVLLIFALPLLVIVVLGAYAYRLSHRVQTLEVAQRNDDALRRINVVERMMQKYPTQAWAIHEYEQVAKEYPHPQVLVRLGALYYGDGLAEKALAVLEDAKKRDPEYWEIYSTAAYIYLDQHRVEHAIEAGEHALNLNPWDAQTYNNLAWLYTIHAEVRDLAKAQEYISKAVDYTRGRDPNALSTLETLLEVYAKTGNIDRAVDILEAVLNRIGHKGTGAESLQRRLETLRALQASVRKE